MCFCFSSLHLCVSATRLVACDHVLRLIIITQLADDGREDQSAQVLEGSRLEYSLETSSIFQKQPCFTAVCSDRVGQNAANVYTSLGAHCQYRCASLQCAR